MAMNRATPKYQATGVSSGQEAPKTASLSPTVLREHDVLCSYTSYCTVALEITNSMGKKKD